MKTMRLSFFSALLLLAIPVAHASGPLGIYGVIERVVFEPDADAPERIRVFGAFAFFDAMSGLGGSHTAPERGYLYFRLPDGGNPAQLRREWADLAAVAGTGEAVAFGHYGFIGRIEDIDTATGRQTGSRNAYVLLNRAQRQFGVHPESRESVEPVEYISGGVGVVPLGEGNYDAIVEDLEAALER